MSWTPSISTPPSLTSKALRTPKASPAEHWRTSGRDTRASAAHSADGFVSDVFKTLPGRRAQRGSSVTPTSLSRDQPHKHRTPSTVPHHRGFGPTELTTNRGESGNVHIVGDTHNGGIIENVNTNHQSFGVGGTSDMDANSFGMTIVESPVLPGVPMVLRNVNSREENPERLNLNDMGFTVCPILEHEYQLRMLNLQQNNIKTIQHLSNLQNLIFLDLFGNKLTRISGLESLTALRVLMLGGNEIREIAPAFQNTPHLDILDMHSNKIEKIENMATLSYLRVLNISHNRLREFGGIVNLTHLADLNLSHNNIRVITNGFEKLQHLERLDLSHNELTSFENTRGVHKAVGLLELNLTGNLICTEVFHREKWIHQLYRLRNFDNKRVTDDERRVAGITLRKDGEKRRDRERDASAKAGRVAEINTIQKQWREYCANHCEPAQWHSFTEIEGDVLHVYGSPQDPLENTKLPNITGAHFYFCRISDITSFLHKTRNRMPNITKLTLQETNAATFKHIGALASLKKIEHLVLEPDQPLIKTLSLWKKYLIYRLAQLPLKTINEKEISIVEIEMSKSAFHIFDELRSMREVNASNDSNKRIENGDLKQSNSRKDRSGRTSTTPARDREHQHNNHHHQQHQQQQQQQQQQRSQSGHRDSKPNPTTLKRFTAQATHDLVMQAISTHQKQQAIDEVFEQCIEDVLMESFRDTSVVSLESLK